MSRRRRPRTSSGSATDGSSLSASSPAATHSVTGWSRPISASCSAPGDSHSEQTSNTSEVARLIPICSRAASRKRRCRWLRETSKPASFTSRYGSGQTGLGVLRHQLLQLRVTLGVVVGGPARHGLPGVVVGRQNSSRVRRLIRRPCADLRGQAETPPVDRTTAGRRSLQTEWSMRAILVGNEVSQHRSDMALAERQDVIQTLPA